MADLSSCPALEPCSIVEAHRRIRPYVKRTSLLVSVELNQLASLRRATSTIEGTPLNGPEDSATTHLPTPKFNIYLKCENLQRTGAFKARGAFHAVIRLIESEGETAIRQRGVITASSGNHAQGLALAAITFGIPAVIIMPRSSASSKVRGVAETLEIAEMGETGGKSAKGEIVFCGSSNDEKQAAVAEAVKMTGCIFVPPYAHPDIILGQGTCALEAEEQFRTLKRSAREDEVRQPAVLDAIIAPLGGGGLLGGIATWFSDEAGTKVFGAEPSFQGADDGRRGLDAGARICHVASSTIADGLRTPVGPLNWEIVKDKSKVEGVFSIGEAEIEAAMRVLYKETGLVVEPSGCVPLAVLLFDQNFRRLAFEDQLKNGGKTWDIAVVLSGGNISEGAMAKVTANPKQQRVDSKL